MYIKKINNFLKEYSNLSKEDYLNILKKSNKDFPLDKVEKDFLLSLVLIKFWQRI